MSSFDICCEGKGNDIRSDESCVCVYTRVFGDRCYYFRKGVWGALPNEVTSAQRSEGNEGAGCIDL